MTLDCRWFHFKRCRFFADLRRLVHQLNDRSHYSSSEKAQFIVTFITHFAWGNDIYQIIHSGIMDSFFHQDIYRRRLEQNIDIRTVHTWQPHRVGSWINLPKATHKPAHSHMSTCCQPHAKTKTTQTAFTWDTRSRAPQTIVSRHCYSPTSMQMQETLLCCKI